MIYMEKIFFAVQPFCSFRRSYMAWVTLTSYIYIYEAKSRIKLENITLYRCNENKVKFYLYLSACQGRPVSTISSWPGGVRVAPIPRILYREVPGYCGGPVWTIPSRAGSDRVAPIPRILDREITGYIGGPVWTIPSRACGDRITQISMILSRAKTGFSCKLNFIHKTYVCIRPGGGGGIIAQPYGKGYLLARVVDPDPDPDPH
jgi:hypothetical protein